MKFNIIPIAIAICALTSCTTDKKKQAPLQTTNAATETTLVEKPLLAEVVNTISEPEAPIYFVNAGSGLSLRSGTNLKSKKILTIPYGGQITHISSPEHTAMTVAGIKGEMVEVDYQGAKGFVFNGYLTQLAPPQNEETVSAYAKRISTKENPVKITKVKHPKGDEFGLTTTIQLPAKNWTEAYRVTKRLFNLPASLQLDLNNKKTGPVIVNKNKRDKTFKDEVVIARNASGAIQNIEYNYQLRDYSRSVRIVKEKRGFAIKEIETSK